MAQWYLRSVGSGSKDKDPGFKNREGGGGGRSGDSPGQGGADGEPLDVSGQLGEALAHEHGSVLLACRSPSSRNPER